MGDAIPLNQVVAFASVASKSMNFIEKHRKNYTYCRSIFLHVDMPQQATSDGCVLLSCPQQCQQQAFGNYNEEYF